MIRLEPNSKPSRQAMQGDNLPSVKSLILRIEQVKSEQDALGEDIRGIYAEAKSHGYDKTALGQAVAIRRKRAKDPHKFEEMSATVALYLDECKGIASRAHTPVRAREASEPSASPGFSPKPQELPDIPPGLDRRPKEAAV